MVVFLNSLSIIYHELEIYFAVKGANLQILRSNNPHSFQHFPVLLLLWIQRHLLRCSSLRDHQWNLRNRAGRCLGTRTAEWSYRDRRTVWIISQFFPSQQIHKKVHRWLCRQCLIIANIFSIVFGGLIYIPHFYTFITFRFMQGLCVGVFSSLSPLIIKEISPLEISGMMGNFSQFNLTGGVLFCQILSYVLKKATGDTSGESFWYIIFGFSLVTQFIQLLVLTFVFPY